MKNSGIFNTSIRKPPLITFGCCTKSTSLAELLAKFTFRRPLYTQEASALCYQLLQQLKQHISGSPTNPWIQQLNFPSLSNIYLTENGTAFVKPIKNVKKLNYSPNDWLYAFAQTLKSHTINNTTKESETFQSLIDSLTGQCFDYYQLIEKIDIWLKTCLYLCSIVHQSDNPLKDFQRRSIQAQNSRNLSSELRRKNMLLVKITKPMVDSDVIPSPACLEENSSACSDHGSGEREAFEKWAEKWKFVNAEYLAKQITKAARLSEQKADRSDPFKDRTTRAECGETRLPVKSRIDPVGDVKEYGGQSGIVASDQNCYMDTLKSMYSSFISHPLTLLQRGFRASPGQTRPSEVKHSAFSKTLAELANVLRSGRSQ
ncbi:unnamed protein product [Calicophoron daubneyi]|uniref:Uncharacterized protein n=1 Tax=Calicophoron daubneyi TaxID=300641 RepID=A0AAV2TNN6_CALDB